MKLLLVDNGSDTRKELYDLCIRCGWQVTTIHHRELLVTPVTEFDLAILSGGWWYDDEIELLSEYAAEIQFINTSTVPILGICIGMQLMHVALNEAVPLLDAPQSGFHDIQLTTRGQQLFCLPATIRVFKNHTRAIIEAAPDFEVLADSPSGVEIILHRHRQLLGVQFHPELEDNTERATQLLISLTGALLENKEHTLVSQIDCSTISQNNSLAKS